MHNVTTLILSCVKNRQFHTFVYVLIFAITFGCWVSACSFQKSKPESGLLRVQVSSEPVTLDPSLVEDGLGFRILVNIMDGLMAYDNQGVLQKSLAESYKVTNQGRTYRFKIVKNRKWSDGVPLELSHFIFGLKRALDPKTGSKLSSLLKGIRRYYIEKDELVFELTRADPVFLQYLSLPVTFPLREDVLNKTQQKWDPLRNKDVPTIGDYQVASYKRDQSILLKAREHVDQSSPQKVLIRVVQDESTGASLFEKNEIDVLSRIPSYDLKKYQKMDGYQNTPFLATYFLGFNLKQKPFDQKIYRQAVAGAIHKKELVSLLATGEEPASSWIPRGLNGHYDYIENNQGLDPRFANAVEQVKKQKLSVTVSLGFDTSGRNSMIMEKIQSDLKKNLGWQVELKNTDWKTHVRSIYSDPPMIYRFGWSTPVLDSLIFISPFVSGDPFTFTKLSQKSFDEIVGRVRDSKTDASRVTAISEAQRWIVEDEVWVVPVYHYVSTQVVGQRVSRYLINPLGHTRWSEVRFKP